VIPRLSFDIWLFDCRLCWQSLLLSKLSSSVQPSRSTPTLAPRANSSLSLCRVFPCPPLSDAEEIQLSPFSLSLASCQHLGRRFLRQASLLLFSIFPAPLTRPGSAGFPFPARLGVSIRLCSHSLQMIHLFRSPPRSQPRPRLPATRRPQWRRLPLNHHQPCRPSRLPMFHPRPMQHPRQRRIFRPQLSQPS
jgi:hypothetical protein